MTQRASVFIGSSTEGLPIAKAVQKALEPAADVTVWSQGIFEPSFGYLESLMKAVEEADFGVLVLTPDDLTESRGHLSTSPRDNLVFELGLFIGRLGRERCLFLFDTTKELKIPSDLLGIAPVTYRPREDGNFNAAVGPACTSIEDRIRVLGRRPRMLNFIPQDMQSNATLPNLSGKWAGYSPESPTPTKQLSTLEIEQHGTFIRATVQREVSGGTRSFEYEGRFTSGQLVLFFEDREGRGYIVGTVVLHLSPDLQSLVGRSTYFDHSENIVRSSARNYRKIVPG